MSTLAKESFGYTQELDHHYHYDAIVLICGGIEKGDDGDWKVMDIGNDPYGQIRGKIRVESAVDLFLAGLAPIVVISGGKDEKNGDINAPTVASVYEAAFLSDIEKLRKMNEPLSERARLLKPKIIPEESSGNTLGSVKGILSLAQENRWLSLLSVTEPLHTPRTQEYFYGELPHYHFPRFTLGFYEAHPRNGWAFAQRGDLHSVARRIKNEEMGIKDYRERS